MSGLIQLEFANYKLLDYEKEFAEREVVRLFKSPIIGRDDKKVSVSVDNIDPDQIVPIANRLTYFHKATLADTTITLKQADRESNYGVVKTKRQATRFGAHGLHEYKGKFNPQIASTISNLLDLDTTDHIVDPFCGSGTTLLEAQAKGIPSTGFDINPFAIKVANAKLNFSRFSSNTFNGYVDLIEKKMLVGSKSGDNVCDHPNFSYLENWFDNEKLAKIIHIYNTIKLVPDEKYADFFFCLASNLIRDYSKQEPLDLRIRRRKSPYPNSDVDAVFSERMQYYANLLQATPVQNYDAESRAILSDINLYNFSSTEKFTAAITSPPYASALPYIDTQRLSLAWLNLIRSTEIKDLEGNLIGSREANKAAQTAILNSMMLNEANIPDELHGLCLTMQRSLNDNDGFRRKASPLLLYRYFWQMKEMFLVMSKCTSRDAHFALVVGHNHTTLGGRRFDLDTPDYLAQIAAEAGWKMIENTGLQTYQRFGLHRSNSGTKENLVLLGRT